MRRILICFWFVMPVFCPSFASAVELGSLEEVCAYARENSLDYRSALWDALKAGNDLDGILELEEASFGFDTTLREDEDTLASAGVELPILDQISLNASVDSDKNRSYGLTLNPLAHGDDRTQQDLAWQRAAASADRARISAENDAVTAVLGWLSVSRSVGIQRDMTEVRETIYRDEKIRYEAGESTLDEVRTALMDWTDSGKSLTALRNEQSNAESSLLSALNADADSLLLPDLDIRDLEKELAGLKERIDPKEADSFTMYEVLAAQLDVRSLEEELEDTWIFDPDLSLTGSVDTDSSGQSAWSGTLSLSFSLQDWQKEERFELGRDLELSRLEAGKVLMEQSQELQQDLITLENTDQGSELARLELDEAREVYDEAEFLLEQGEYSRAERDEALLDLKQAEVSLFAALADEYTAWRELLYYID